MRAASLFQVREGRYHGAMVPSLETSVATAEPQPSWPRKLNCGEVGPASKRSPENASGKPRQPMAGKEMWSLGAWWTVADKLIGGRTLAKLRQEATSLRSHLSRQLLHLCRLLWVCFSRHFLMRRFWEKSNLAPASQRQKDADSWASVTKSSQASPWPRGAVVAVAAAQVGAEGGWVGEKNKGGT